MHIAIDPHTAPVCSSETTQICLRNTPIRQAQAAYFVFSHDAEHAPCILHSALNVCGNTRTTTRVRQYRFCIARDAPQNYTPSLRSVGENAMLMHMCAYRSSNAHYGFIRFGTRAPPGELVHMQRGKQVTGFLRQYVDIFLLVQRPSACTTHSITPLFNKPSAPTTTLAMYRGMQHVLAA